MRYITLVMSTENDGWQETVRFPGAFVDHDEAQDYATST